MKVSLIAKTLFVGHETEQFERAREDQLRGSSGEVLTEYAARVCYDSFGRGRDSTSFHEHIKESAHVNVLYHAHFSMLISGVSRNLTHELVRHHVGFSPSMRSTRYVDERESPVIHHPEVLRLLSEDLGFMERSRRFDHAFRSLYAYVADQLADVTDRKTAQGAAARYLPNGIETELVWTGNAQAFRSLIERRSVPGVVDAEFVELAQEMNKILAEEMPSYFKANE
jgi:thymidylate synthase (FAD)